MLTLTTIVVVAAETAWGLRNMQRNRALEQHVADRLARDTMMPPLLPGSVRRARSARIAMFDRR
ncbi:MAG: hypothetical protein MUF73_06475 [Rhodobacteraceae bacterium]|jgi:hypothetical protein|nr:hypothetical protein [Paracoccaceae bacterium]